MVKKYKLYASRHLLGIIAALLLAGCAAISDAPAVTAAPAATGAVSGNFLQPWPDMTGAMMGALPGKVAASASYIQLRHPSAISAHNNDIYLVDAGLRRIFRYDAARQTLAPFTTLTPDAGTSIYVAPDLSVYVVAPASGQVLHFTRDGVQLPSLSALGDLVHPIAVAVDESGARVLVADGLYNQIVVFNNMGRPLSAIKNPQQLRAIAAVAAGPDGIYAVDSIARQVVVLGWDGAFRYAFGAGDLRSPTTIAVSRDNIVFVGDSFDRAVKIYRVKKSPDGIVATAAGMAPGSFGGISGLAVNGRMLYVTDGPNARVKIFQINP